MDGKKSKFSQTMAIDRLNKTKFTCGSTKGKKIEKKLKRRSQKNRSR